MIVINGSAQKDVLTVDGRSVSQFDLAKDAGICLGQLLQPLHLRVDLVDLLVWLTLDAVDRSRAEIPSAGGSILKTSKNPLLSMSWSPKLPAFVRLCK